MRSLVWALGWMSVLVLSAVGQCAEQNDPLQGATERIKQHRLGEFALQLVDGQGTVFRNATVEVELVSHDVLFGCNLFSWSEDKDDFQKEYRRRFAALFNCATVAFYWPEYEKEPGKTDDKRIRKVAAWCAEHGIAVKGHPLIWNFMDPPWLPDDEAKVRALTFARVDKLVGDFSGTIDIWDVLNEPTAWERNAKGAPKTTAAITGMGKIEACKEALRRARKANPGATLIINDYVTGEEYYAILDQLRDDEGRLLFDAVGIQTHMHSGPRPLDEIWAICERFGRLGVPLHFTETTVLSEYPDKGLGEQETAQYVEDYYTLLFSHPAVEAISWWDFSDRNSWMSAKAGFLDVDGSPKPVYERIMELIHETWTTKGTLRSDANGVIRWRGFYGTYAVRIKQGPTGALEKQVRIARRDPTTHKQRVLMR
jgi:endo-1,4-beta-xylanase